MRTLAPASIRVMFLDHEAGLGREILLRPIVVLSDGAFRVGLEVGLADGVVCPVFGVAN